MSRPGSVWSKVGSAAGAKILVMGVTGLIGIFTNRLIIQSFGTEVYGFYGLLTTMPSLLPFADLGMAAVVINALAESEDPRRDPRVSRTLATALRILAASGLTIVAVSGVLTLSGSWPAVLGRGGVLPGAELVPFVCLAMYGLALPLSIGPRTLVGLNRTTTQIAATGITGPLVFGGMWLLATSGWAGAGSLAPVVPYLASAAVSALCLVLAARIIRPQVSNAFREFPRPRRYPGVRAVHLAWPMLVQMLALPIAMQTDRLLLSHLTRGTELAEYNLGSQLFGLILQTIAASGVALWPIFARARSQRELLSPIKPTLVFLALGLAAGGAMVLVSPWLVDFVAGGRLHLDGWLLGGFLIFVALQAAKYPAGMYMTDHAGLRFQVLPILIMVPVNLALSWWLIGLVGAGGPILGSAIAVLACQVIPNLVYVSRDFQRRRGELQAEDAADGGPAPESD